MKRHIISWPSLKFLLRSSVKAQMMLVAIPIISFLCVVLIVRFPQGAPTEVVAMVKSATVMNGYSNTWFDITCILPSGETVIVSLPKLVRPNVGKKIVLIKQPLLYFSDSYRFIRYLEK